MVPHHSLIVNYRKLNGILSYLILSRPYLSFVVSDTSICMQKPHELHWKVTKHILNYVQGTREFWIPILLVHNYIWLVLLIQTGLVVVLTRNIHKDLFSCWDLDQSVGQERSKKLLFSLQLKYSISGIWMQLLGSFSTWDSDIVWPSHLSFSRHLLWYSYCNRDIQWSSSEFGEQDIQWSTSEVGEQ